MNEIAFRNWLICNGRSKKTASDACVRIKKIERELGPIDIDIEYEKDQCCHLLSLFDNIGRNEKMNMYNTTLPIGKYYLSTYKYAVNQYIMYRNSIIN